jgi:hypothetical protein
MTDSTIQPDFEARIVNDGGAWVWHIVSDQSSTGGVVASSTRAFRSELEAQLDCNRKLIAMRSNGRQFDKP